MTLHTATRAADLPQTDPDAARDHAAAEYDALLAMVDAFVATDWDLPTDCTGWRVRHLVAHVAGAAEEDDGLGFVECVLHVSGIARS